MKSHPLIALALICAACGSQVDSDYDGESIATFRAELVTAPQAGTPPLDVALWWPGIARGELQRVQVSAGFPSSVVLEVTQPPPDDVLIGNAGSVPWGARFGCEPLILVDQETQELGPGLTLGVTEHHVICYMKDPVVAGTPLSTILGGAYEPGYHVVRVEHRQTRSEAEDAGTLPAYEAELAQCRSDWDALHGSGAVDGWYFCTLDRAHPSEDGLDTVMPLTLGDYVFPNFHLDT